MKFWIPLFSAVILLILYPYIRYAVKRIGLWFKLKKVCKKQKFKIFGTKPLWIFSTNSSETCDCYIETKEKVYAIKLFSVLERKSVLIFNYDGSYSLRTYALTFIPSLQNQKGNERKTMLPNYRFRYKYHLDWEIKTPKKILLINPICGEIRKRTESQKEIILGVHESVNGAEIYNATYFITNLEMKENDRTEFFI